MATGVKGKRKCVHFSREKEYSAEQKIKWICCLRSRYGYARICTISSTANHIYFSTSASNFSHLKWCATTRTYLEKGRRSISPSCNPVLKSLFHVSHLVRHAPCCAFLFLHYSLQLKSGWISDELHWAQGGIEHRVNKPCPDLHSLSSSDSSYKFFNQKTLCRARETSS